MAASLSGEPDGQRGLGIQSRAGDHDLNQSSDGLGPNLSAALRWARALGLPASEARLLLSRALDRDPAWLLANDDAALPDAQKLKYLDWVLRRQRGEPIAYLLGERAFHAITLQVGPGVLIPRPETELLVELAIAMAPPQGCVVDLGTGSGAIALAVAKARPDLVVHGTDQSEQALSQAQANALRLGLNVQWHWGSWYAALPSDLKADVLVSNPPYIAATDPHLLEGDLRFEPRSALTDGADGLQDLTALAEGAHAHLKPGGWLWLEHGYDQAHALRTRMLAAGFLEVQSRCDLAGIERCTGGRMPFSF